MHQPVVHQTVWCAPDSVRYPGWPGDELFALENFLRAPRLKFTGLSGEPTAPTTNGRQRDQRVTRGQANDHLVAPDSVRCAMGTEGATVGFARKGRRSGTRQVLFMSGGALDFPVRHPTEGKNCLPNGTPTAPSCLGAIKGTPRRMEHNTKHSLNILRRLDFATTHSDHRVRYLSTV
jgi:hypothetical protein